mmetsp:Transcript_56180/g.174648  ORF Transcript_56180/g.174648 Transcript_56180/m.174648 type:complete len:239 (+) Transcript_56180:45-761(+)
MLKLYGTGVSQPVRAVMWACGLGKLPYQLIYSLPYQDKFSDDAARPRCDTHAKEFPSASRQIPAIDDNGFVLAESNAILTYLASTRGWDTLYPPNPCERALVDQYLHFHHHNTRSITLGMFMPIVHPGRVAGKAALVDHHRSVALRTLRHLEDTALSDTGEFLHGSCVPRLSDIVAYSEVGQLRLLGIHSLEGLPRLNRWLARMERVKGHEEAHAALLAWRPTFEKLRAASLSAQGVA